LTDSEVDDAQKCAGTWESGHGKPQSADEAPNKWCVRECERSTLIGDNDVLAIDDFDKPVFNNAKGSFKINNREFIMNDDKQIKQISNFFSSSKDMKQRIVFTTSLMAVTGLIHTALMFTIAEYEVFALLAWIITSIKWTLMVTDTKEKRGSVVLYQKWLSSKKVDTLQFMAKSPEIDSDSKHQIITYLNNEKVGWSLP
jgi:hypothetical protein